MLEGQLNRLKGIDFKNQRFGFGNRNPITENRKLTTLVSD
jgi:hypothetical protein